ncbi:YggS family pyridoxal phosphate-dependent enzyme [Arthrobacter sp. SX1312]|uniref:YggS family pyridoxal phosphate-dependent enzyme n=1 Tax=Arthrobacter sp. SX1312 TaxID=2058896 RepID=UPI000CE3548F|nr:YggS family pyridoxal phosphate-dependent enzyme [Arthrobacter sp. SX1312]
MSPEVSPGSARDRELAERLRAVRTRISSAAASAGRGEPELIVVTKYFPASDVRILAGLGVTDVGENRDQEAAAKAAELQDLTLAWHFIGQLQANKARSVVRYAHSVHSVDRLPLIASLGKAVRAEQERRAAAGTGAREDLRCFLQFTLDAGAGPAEASAGRGGAHPSEAAGLAEACAATDGLQLAGVMAVAPLGADPVEVFERLLRISAEVRGVDPAASAVSAGMSGDLEEAVAAGATHLRIGSDVLGPRPAVG